MLSRNSIVFALLLVSITLNSAIAFDIIIPCTVTSTCEPTQTAGHPLEAVFEDVFEPMEDNAETHEVIAEAQWLDTIDEVPALKACIDQPTCDSGITMTENVRADFDGRRIDVAVTGDGAAPIIVFAIPVVWEVEAVGQEIIACPKDADLNVISPSGDCFRILLNDPDGAGGNPPYTVADPDVDPGIPAIVVSKNPDGGGPLLTVIFNIKDPSGKFVNLIVRYDAAGTGIEDREMYTITGAGDLVAKAADSHFDATTLHDIVGYVKIGADMFAINVPYSGNPGLLALAANPSVYAVTGVSPDAAEFTDVDFVDSFSVDVIGTAKISTGGTQKIEMRKAWPTGAILCDLSSTFTDVDLTGGTIDMPGAGGIIVDSINPTDIYCDPFNQNSECPAGEYCGWYGYAWECGAPPPAEGAKTIASWSAQGLDNLDLTRIIGGITVADHSLCTQTSFILDTPEKREVKPKDSAINTDGNVLGTPEVLIAFNELGTQGVGPLSEVIDTEIYGVTDDVVTRSWIIEGMQTNDISYGNTHVLNVGQGFLEKGDVAITELQSDPDGPGPLSGAHVTNRFHFTKTSALDFPTICSGSDIISGVSGTFFAACGTEGVEFTSLLALAVIQQVPEFGFVTLAGTLIVAVIFIFVVRRRR